MTINTVIFSKDRAMQLDLLLRSIERYLIGYGIPQSIYRRTVIYKSSNPEFAKGYNLCMEAHRGAIDWMPQASLKRDVLWAIDFAVTYTMMLVDDDVFFKPLPDFKILAGETYAPRLGQNITYCYNRQKKGLEDFRVSASLDGHIYYTEEILPWLEQAVFETPGQLEDWLWPRATWKIKHGEHSCLVGIPHNRVGEYPNRHAGGSAAMLNTLFLGGQRINLDAMDFSHVNSVHQEIPYVFI